MKTWVIPCRIVEYRNVCVEAETQKEAMENFRARDWVEGDDADETRSEVYKVGKITVRDE